jgi:hypothetical protein
MAEAKLINHRGAREVLLEDLLKVQAPPATRTWYPLSHGQVWRTVERAVADAGYEVLKARHVLSRGDSRFFGVMDLTSKVVPGVGLAVGVRNSTDKTLPIGFCAGSRVFVCDNLAFSSEVVIARRHTRFGEERFAEALAAAVRSLASFRRAEEERVRHMQATPLDDTRAESLMLRAYEQGLVGPRLLPKVIRQWRQPEHEDFWPRTLWSCFNAFTGALSPCLRGDPQRFSRLTIRLHGLLAPDAVTAQAV